MKKILSILLICVLFLSSPSFVGAKETSRSESEIKEQFTELGIDKATQEKLLTKIENGETVDSMKPKNIEKLLDKSGSLGPNESVSMTYPDGSVGKVGNFELIPKFSALSSTRVRTVESYWMSGLVNVGFFTDFVTPSKQNDYIIRSYDETAVIIGGELVSDELTIGRKTETSSRRAYSKYKIKYKVLDGWVGSTFDIYFHVGNNTYETKLSLDDKK